MNRRSFLKFAARLNLTWLFTSLGGCASSSQVAGNKDHHNRGRIYFYRNDFSKPNSFVDQGMVPNQDASKPDRTWLCEFDLSTGKIREADVSSVQYGHSVIFDKIRKRILCLPKLETKVPIIDFETFQQVASLEAPEGLQFYGHGAIHPVDNDFYLSMSNERGDGQIAVINSDSLKMNRRFDSFGYSPHDVHFLADQTMVVANSGWSHKAYKRELPSSICFIDVSKTKPTLKNKVVTNHRGVTAHHMAFESQGDPANPLIYVGLATPFSKVSVPGQKSLVAVVHANEFRLFTNEKVGIEVLHYNVLSLAGVTTTGAVVTTTPETVAALWDSKMNGLLRTIEEIKHPKGVNVATDTGELRRSKFYVTTASAGIFELIVERGLDHLLKVDGLRVVPGSEVLKNVSGHSLLVG